MVVDVKHVVVDTSEFEESDSDEYRSRHDGYHHHKIHHHYGIDDEEHSGRQFENLTQALHTTTLKDSRATRGASDFSWWFELEFSVAECEEFFEQPITNVERCSCGDISRDSLRGVDPCWLDVEIKVLEFATGISESVRDIMDVRTTLAANHIRSVNVNTIDVGRGHRLVAPRAQHRSNGPYGRYKSVLVSVGCRVETLNGETKDACDELEKRVKHAVEQGDIVGGMELDDGFQMQVAPAEVFFRQSKQKPPCTSAEEKFMSGTTTRPCAFDSKTIWTPKFCVIHGEKEPLSEDSVTSPVYGPLHPMLTPSFEQQAVRISMAQVSDAQDAFRRRREQIEAEQREAAQQREDKRLARKHQKLEEERRRQQREAATMERRLAREAREHEKIMEDQLLQTNRKEQRSARREARRRAEREATLRIREQEKIAKEAELEAREARKAHLTARTKQKIWEADQYARERHERTERARLKSRAGAEHKKRAEQRRQDLEDQKRILETLRIEQQRAMEGKKRWQQGKRAINWGGTHEAQRAESKQKLRAARTEYARAKSMERVKRLHEASFVSAREEDEAAVLETLRIEQVRAAEGALRRKQGQQAIDWGGTEEAQRVEEKQRIRRERTEIARLRSKQRVEEIAQARQAQADAAEEAAALVTLRREQMRALEGHKRWQQGKAAIDWGGTEEAERERRRQEERSLRTEIARQKSFVKTRSLRRALNEPLPDSTPAWYPAGAISDNLRATTDRRRSR